MISWIADIRQDNDSKKYSYSIYDISNQFYFTSRPYTTEQYCIDGLEALKKLISGKMESFSRIVVRGDWCYFEIINHTSNVLGYSGIAKGEAACNTLLEEFCNLMTQEGRLYDALRWRYVYP